MRESFTWTHGTITTKQASWAFLHTERYRETACQNPEQAALVREASVCHEWWLTPRPRTAKVPRTKACCELSPKWDINSVLWRLKKHQRAGGKNQRMGSILWKIAIWTWHGCYLHGPTALVDTCSRLDWSPVHPWVCRQLMVVGERSQWFRPW